jgi:hypothetical protein
MEAGRVLATDNSRTGPQTLLGAGRENEDLETAGPSSPGTCALNRGAGRTETVRVQGRGTRSMTFRKGGDRRESRRPKLPCLNSPMLHASSKDRQRTKLIK